MIVKTRYSLGLGYSFYASAESLSSQFYEELINRGWRRSGTLLYKPDQRASCCPHYTIRLDGHAFKATKDQRQAVNRFNRYILGEKCIKESARTAPKSKEEAARRKQEFDLSERIHESEFQILTRPPDPAHEFVVTLESDEYTEEKYALFENYQRIVHHEPPHRISKSGFCSFLCKSPLLRHVEIVDGRQRRLGSFHQCYRLDGKLVAIGVLDLLPHSVSAVYFMYHESIHTWSPGKLSAMRETALAAEEGYRWYMMGFYIHDCRKMKYKIDFHPQYVLDPETFAWDLFDDDLKRRLDARPYVSLSRERREGIEAPSNGTGTKFKDIDRGVLSANDEDNNSASDGDFDWSISLFSRGMPGVLSRDYVDSLPNGSITLRVGGRFVCAEDLVNWDGGSIDDPYTIKGIISELVATIGPEFASKMVVSFK